MRSHTRSPRQEKLVGYTKPRVVMKEHSCVKGGSDALPNRADDDRDPAPRGPSHGGRGRPRQGDDRVARSAAAFSWNIAWANDVSWLFQGSAR
jgi:hypothetical protein